MKKTILMFFLLTIGIVAVLQAQESFDPDAKFLEARKLILDGKRDEGRKMAKMVLERYPNYSDYHILIGRSYSWDGKYDSASYYLDQAITISPQYEDAYLAYVDNLFYAEDYEKAKEIIELGLEKVGPSSTNLKYRKSRHLYYTEEYKEALALANELFNKGAKIDGLLNYIRQVQRFTRINAVGATYDYDNFRGALTPWNTYSVYGRTRTNLTGSIIGRITHSDRFDGRGTQYEVDAFPSLGENSYGYINLGVSNASFFPSFRFGGSVFWNLKKAWEIEGGYRLLMFTENTHIYTGSLGKYVSNWWVNLRLNYIPGQGGSSTSGNIQARYYFKGPEDFFSAQFSTGVSPDEENRDFQSQLLNSYRLRLGYQHLWTDRWMGFGFVGYSRDELSATNFRNNLNISIGTEFRF
ncbi:YaiO family outer membrane beta-barrel protein [Mongoliibacter ruber]|uniref:YaiO family outer membrane protein n=1 Tax=Mongoliibacter ruber TaxID=1750599 RepID=A0A2T0WWB7_9BACT|nr:YaiO family outer membrane beta-barrel protein [Mongoliibacter ruber]PRY90981.1 YaiO family outer membrane protein [Mongoliibacter ruber]